MDFIMPASAKAKRVLSFGLCLALFAGLLGRATFLHAVETITEVRHIDFELKKGQYFLSTDIQYGLTPTAREALQKGIPLYWDVLIKVVRERNWLWNKTLVNFKIRYRIQYHALLNNYRVTNITSSDSSNYITLTAALDGMAEIRDIAVLDEEDIEKNETYRVSVKARFDREALPLPLRPASYLNPQWYLSSAWLQWPLQK